MATIDNWYKEALCGVMQEGETRNTRTGEVISKFNPIDLRNYDMSRNGFPLLTCKKVNIKLVIGELLWFLSGKTDLKSLRHYSGLPEGANTIWSADFKRYRDNTPYGDAAREYYDRTEELGDIYGSQWRSFGDYTSEQYDTVDQIANLIDKIQNDPTSRYQMVTSYNPVTTENDNAALPPCHTFFQTYVDNQDCLHLKWYQRSADMFLGLPFNIASYALLLKILAKITNKYEGTLSGTFGDMHIYSNHMEAIETVIGNECYDAPKISLPPFNTLDELLELTANDFILYEYDNAGVVTAPLSVG